MRSGRYLLDANVLIAVTASDHEHHSRAVAFATRADGLVLCPVVEGALTRFMVRIGESPHAARAVVARWHEAPGVSFVPDSLSYADVDLAGVTGHRQVTDRYLVALAAHHGVRLATLDRALAESAPVVAELVT